MKEGIHPKYGEAVVRCVCGETFTTGSTKKELKVEICSKCHPFFTGKQKLVDSGGRVDKFKKRYQHDIACFLFNRCALARFALYSPKTRMGGGAMQPTILAFRLSDERLRTLRAVASAQGLAIIAVPPSDFSQTLGALCALDARNPLAAPCDFAGEMLVMAGLSDAQSDRLLAALRLCLQPNIALKAVLTPANRRWTAAYLYQELCMEHAALRAGKGARG